jgi:hypothetical protein
MVRYYYTLAMRTLGLGTYKAGWTKSEWTKYKLNWLDSYTLYRSRGEICDTFARYFDLKFHEKDYLRFRLPLDRRTKASVGLLDLPLVAGLAAELLRRATGMVLHAQRR